MTRYSSLCALLSLASSIALVTPATAGVTITVPSDLPPGQNFIVAFLDSTPHNAATDSISYYNSLIWSDAQFTLSGVSVINSGVLAAASSNQAFTVLNSSLPIYNTQGHKIASSGSSLLGASISLDQNGANPGIQVVWTGLTSSGASAPGLTLGSASVEYGKSGLTLNNGGFATGNASNNLNHDFYGYAQFTPSALQQSVVPEPATFTMVAMALGLLGGARGLRRRRVVGTAPSACPTVRS